MKQSIAADAVKLTTSKVITMLISMISAMLLSRFRTLEEYGTYSQLLLVINLVTTILMLGLPNSINFFLARAENDKERRVFLSVYYTISTVLGLFTGLVLVLSTPLIVDYFRNPFIKDFMYFFAVYPWSMIILSSIENVLIVYHRTNFLMVFRIMNSVALLFIIFIVELLGWGFPAYMGMFVFVEGVFALSVYSIVGKISEGLTISVDKRLIKGVLEFSIPVGLASVIGVLNIQLDKMVIGKFFSVEEIAIYTNAAREMPVTIIASSLTAVLMPQIARLLKENKSKEAVNIWGDSIILSYTLICFISLGLFVFAPEVISLLYSKKYLPGVEVFRIYSLVLLLRATYFGMMLNAIGKTKFIFYSSLASLGVNLLLNYVFYRVLGFVGPAIATFISISMIQLYQLIATAINIKIELKYIFPWKDVGVITVINLILGVIFAYIKALVPIETLNGEVCESIVLGGIWAIIYLLIMRKQIIDKWKNLSRNTN